LGTTANPSFSPVSNTGQPLAVAQPLGDTLDPGATSPRSPAPHDPYQPTRLTVRHGHAGQERPEVVHESPLSRTHPPSFSPTPTPHTEMARLILRRQLKSMFPATCGIPFASFLSLRPRGLLTDEVIETYLDGIWPQAPDCYLFRPQFYTLLMQEHREKPEDHGYNYHMTGRTRHRVLSRRGNIFTRTALLFPVHRQKRLHWTCAIVYLTSYTIAYF